MQRIEPRQHASARAQYYPPDLLADIQDTLSVLADIDLRYRKAFDRLEERSQHRRRDQLLSQLESRRRRERRMHERHLTRLQERITSIVLQDLRSLN